MRVEWRPSADAELDDIIAYVEQHNPLAAYSLLGAILEAGESLAAFPHRGRRGRAPGTRELLSVRPYRLLYEVDDRAGLVRVLSVWHGAMRR